MAADHHVLFGVIALRNGLIDRGQLVAAFRDWIRDKARPLADHLVDRGHLDTDQRQAVDALVTLHLKRHEGDPERSLASIPADRSTREELQALADPELTATVAGFGFGSGSDETAAAPTDATATFSIGSASAEGQRFRVLRLHARGGLGAVFVALDAELNREVALKRILDLHADDPSSRQRFLLEAEITGGLEHPGIVPVYGLGSYGDGRPYYAMRFIRGDNLKEAIDRFHADATLKSEPGRRSLELRKLLRRFLDVCNALEYAHSRGVLHRDIKPGNVIVGKHGETLVVDWGLAKAVGRADFDPSVDERPLSPSSASGSAETLPGSALGTPAYMSPEQARGDLAVLGRHSDVYSLGATLYCLLTGRAPFEGDDLASLLRAVRQGEFSPPRRLDPSIDRALEAVCLKAMANRPEDRYDSARALAEDIERWLADEPVTAWREPIVRRLWRLVKRHRTQAAALAALLLTAVIGLGIGNLLLRDANARIEGQRREVDRQRRRAETNLEASEANYRLARGAVDSFLTQVAEETLLTEPHMDRLRRGLLETARRFYAEFVARRRDDPRARLDLGIAHAKLADVLWDLGQSEEAIAQYETGRAMLESVPSDDPSHDAARRQLISLLRTQGRRLGEMGGRPDQAIERLREAVRIAEERRKLRPTEIEHRLELALTRNGLGANLRDQRRIDDARAELQAADRLVAEVLRDAPDSIPARVVGARVALQLGILAYALEDNTACEAAYERSRKFYEEVVSREDMRPKVLQEFAAVRTNLASIYRRVGKHAEAVNESLAAAELFRQLIRDHPAVSAYQESLATVLSNLAAILETRRDFDEAERVFNEAMEIRTRMAAVYPSRLDLAIGLGATEGNAGNARLGRREFDKALTWFDRSIATCEAVLKREPNHLFVRNTLRNDYWGRADALTALGRLTEALPAFDRAAELALPKDRSEIRMNRAVVQARTGDYAGASAEVDARTGTPTTVRLFWFESARVLARASEAARLDPKLDVEARTRLADGLIDRAWAALGRARDSGYFTTSQGSARLRNDRDLDPIRAQPGSRPRLMDLAFPPDPFLRTP